MSLGQDEMLRLFGLQEPLIEKYGSNIELIDASIEVVDGIIPEDRKEIRFCCYTIYSASSPIHNVETCRD